MKQIVLIFSAFMLMYACSPSRAINKTRERLVGNYKMELVLSEEEIKENPSAKILMDSMKSTCYFKPDGRMYLSTEMTGIFRYDTADWNVKGDNLISISKGKRDTVSMTKFKGGFTISHKSEADEITTIKFTKLK